MNRITKSDKVRAFVRNGEFKKALAITKGFRLGMTKEQNDRMTRAYECMTHAGFYEQIGINPEEAISDGINVLKQLYA